jgi:hypothetical protein
MVARKGRTSSVAEESVVLVPVAVIAPFVPASLLTRRCGPRGGVSKMAWSGSWILIWIGLLTGFSSMC